MADILKFGKLNFELFVDCGSDQSLAINMANKKINYLKLLQNVGWYESTL